MIIASKIVCGELKENCYIVYDDVTHDAVVIDPGAEYEKINSLINNNHLKVNAVLITHGHFDHIGACYKFKEKNIKIVIHKNDASKCTSNELNLAQSFSGYSITTFEPDYLITKEQEELNFGSIKIIAIHTPGHSEGGCTFVIDNYIFTGDTLFERGYGRTDFYDGSFSKLINSIKKILQYTKSGYIVMAGH